MKDDGFEIVAAAQDTGGEEVAGRFYDRAEASFTCLIDTQHTVTSLFGMVNVPSGVWIDEEGRIVRPPEVAYSRQMGFGSLSAGDDRYAEALRDWVRNGAESPYVFTADELRESLRLANPQRPRADAHFKLAVYLHGQGEAEAASRHWDRAQDLDPDNWNYHRQEWSFDAGTAGGNWRRKFESLGGKPYYKPADLRPRRGKD